MITSVNETNYNRLYDYQPTEIINKDKSEQLKAVTEKYDVSIEARAILNSNYNSVFMRNYIGLTGSHEDKLQNISGKYNELRDMIIEKYKDDEEEQYKQLDELNQAFERALKNTCLVPIYPDKLDHRIYSWTGDPNPIKEAAAKSEWEKVERYNNNVKDVMTNFYDNMVRHVDNFYENFIKSIQNNDFDTAFSESMDLLDKSETKSFYEISYRDTLNIVDSLTNYATEFDEEGIPTKYMFETANDAFKALVKNREIPYYIREKVANMFEFYISK